VYVVWKTQSSVQVKEEALKKLKQEAFIEYKVAEYQTQVVIGVDFKIKVKSTYIAKIKFTCYNLQVQVTPSFTIRDVLYADYIQLMVYCDLKDEYSLTDVTDLGRQP